MNEPATISSECANCERALVLIPDLRLLSFDEGETGCDQIACECGVPVQLLVSEDGTECEIIRGYAPADPDDLQ